MTCLSQVARPFPAFQVFKSYLIHMYCTSLPTLLCFSERIKGSAIRQTSTVLILFASQAWKPWGSMKPGEEWKFEITCVKLLERTRDVVQDTGSSRNSINSYKCGKGAYLQVCLLLCKYIAIAS